MPDIYVNRGDDEQLPENQKSVVSNSNVTRKSVCGVNKPRKYNPLNAFMAWPKRIGVEVLEDDEEVLLLVRQHPIINIRWVFIVLLMIVAAVMLPLFPVYDQLPLRFQSMTVLLWYLFATAIALEGFFNWYFDVFIVTDERIIDVDFDNLIYKNLTYTKIDKIEDVTYSVSGFIPSLLNYGTILIQTAGPANFGSFLGPRVQEPEGPAAVSAKLSQTVPTSEILNAPHPERVVRLINELIMEEEQEKIEGRVR